MVRGDHGDVVFGLKHLCQVRVVGRGNIEELQILEPPHWPLGLGSDAVEHAVVVVELATPHEV
eukprot:CAMPEP_0115461468 /NCGR_PEP_ID=MMETSP0271-20121206/47321_1 /TAXON_ID=71861 /ORGANISM="Scrippsiella trochoidea, Strain CCMP3099" /LENGTH=62 /DNA_ID=CAMNT_0002888219 /DNA_START=93 /DNA_END=281 /DNA_ORIENTATION=+